MGCQIREAPISGARATRFREEPTRTAMDTYLAILILVGALALYVFAEHLEASPGKRAYGLLDGHLAVAARCLLLGVVVVALFKGARTDTTLPFLLFAATCGLAGWFLPALFEKVLQWTGVRSWFRSRRAK